MTTRRIHSAQGKPFVVALSAAAMCVGLSFAEASETKAEQAPVKAEQGPVKAGQGSVRQPNVLFLVVDDLRVDLGCYGVESVQSPNIDQLAAGGLRFDRAYCQQAVCMASRASVLSGYRPDEGRLYNNGPLFKALPNALSLNQHFLNNGYATASIGKTYHHASDYEQGWTVPAVEPEGEWEGRGYLAEASIAEVRSPEQQNRRDGRVGMGPAFESPDVPDAAYPDGVIAKVAVQRMQAWQDRPFFLAVGFGKPHLPFNAPAKYWDLYPADSIALPTHAAPPEGAPSYALTGWGELRGYSGMPKKGPMPPALAKELIRGYRACVTHVDAMIGRVLEELDRLELADDTIVVLWGDHGWKLGDHGMWCKHTNFERDCHVPLILRVPGKQSGSTDALVELVDLYPTLCELCGIDTPNHLQGTSLTPLLENPSRDWKTAAFSQFPRGEKMGYSIRTDQHRYTEWRERQSGEVVGRELYDHQAPNQRWCADTNLADDPTYRATRDQLAKQLRAGPPAAAP